MQPFADKARPKSLDNVFGQKHLLGGGKPLRKIIESDRIPNMLFFGPPGTGKTTVARIIAENAGMTMHKLNGTTAKLSDIKDVISSIGTFAGEGGILLYLDEIQYLNKKQQQSLLEFIENGEITLIASTTENPYFYVYGAILSRCSVFEFKSLTPEDLVPALERGLEMLTEECGYKVTADDEVLEYIASACGGDVRKSLGELELIVFSTDKTKSGKNITLESAKELCGKSAMRYDNKGDEHFDILSALQKSIRGSDENAALHYLARLIEAGDIISPIRRLLVISCEDIGLAYPNAIAIVKACCDSALQLGLPEARIPLAQAVTLLATAPKSNTSYLAIDAALADVRAGKGLGFPRCLQNVHAVGKQNYKYPHDFPKRWVKQQYLPDDIEGAVYYNFGENKNEIASKAYRDWQRGS